MEDRFGAWWAAFLLHALETEKLFRLYGSDERQFLAWALVVASLGNATAGDVRKPASEGCSYPGLAALSGIPNETARRHLLRLVRDGACRRLDRGYSIELPGALEKTVGRQAAALARLLVGVVQPHPLGTRAPILPAAALTRAYLAAGLAFTVNLRRLMARGPFIACAMASLVEIEAVVRQHRLLEQDEDESRVRHAALLSRMERVIVHVTRIAQLASERPTRVHAALLYAGQAGFGSFIDKHRFAFGGPAAGKCCAGDDLVRDVMEPLIELAQAAVTRDVPAAAPSFALPSNDLANHEEASPSR